MVLPRFSAGTISAPVPAACGVERADRQHDQANNQQARIIGREGGGGVGKRKHSERCRQQGAALDPAGQPRRHRRADAEHHRAEGDQQAGGADGDAEIAGQFDQHAGRRQHRAAGHDVAEHQRGRRETPRGAGTVRQIFHARRM
jgi:hypothetical protein